MGNFESPKYKNMISNIKNLKINLYIIYIINIHHNESVFYVYLKPHKKLSFSFVQPRRSLKNSPQKFTGHCDFLILFSLDFCKVQQTFYLTKSSTHSSVFTHRSSSCYNTFSSFFILFFFVFVLFWPQSNNSWNKLLMFLIFIFLVVFIFRFYFCWFVELSRTTNCDCLFFNFLHAFKVTK